MKHDLLLSSFFQGHTNITAKPTGPSFNYTLAPASPDPPTTLVPAVIPTTTITTTTTAAATTSSSAVEGDIQPTDTNATLGLLPVPPPVPPASTVAPQTRPSTEPAPAVTTAEEDNGTTASAPDTTEPVYIGDDTTDSNEFTSHSPPDGEC